MPGQPVVLNPEADTKVPFLIRRIEPDHLELAFQSRTRRAIRFPIGNSHHARERLAWNERKAADAIKPITAQVLGDRLDRLGKSSSPDPDSPSNSITRTPASFGAVRSLARRTAYSRSLWIQVYRIREHDRWVLGLGCILHAIEKRRNSGSNDPLNE
jgi:hypothetical protein